MWGGVGVVSFRFVCAGWVVCRVAFPFQALSRPLVSFQRPSSLLTLFRWRRPWAVFFSMPCWRWRVAPSVLFFRHTFLLLRGVSDCMFPAALHTLLCLWRLVCVSIVWAYLSLPMWACGAGRVLSATLPPRLARLSLCFSLLCGVAWHVTYLYFCRCRGALGVVCVVPSYPISCFPCGGICMRISGRDTLCSLCKRACGGGHVVSATPRRHCCAFLLCIVCSSAAHNMLVFGGRWCCGCLFVFWLFVSG